jgi:hypothetical protein
MAMPLAIGYLVRTPRNPHAALAIAAGDAMSDRPPIPRGVISWTDDALPVGAGDPAAAIDGPPSFRPSCHSVPRREAPARLEGALFVAILAAFLGATSLAVADLARGVVGTTLAADAEPALLGRLPVVETRILSLQPVIDTAATRSPAASASAQGG